VSSTGIHGDVTTKGANWSAGRVWRIEDPIRLQGVVELVQCDAALDLTPESFGTDFSDAAEGRCMNDHTSLSRNWSPRQRCTGSTNANRYPKLFRALKDPDEFIRVRRNHDGIGPEGFVAQSVGVVASELRWRSEYSPANYRLPQNSVESIGVHELVLM
jgi:hypothetical protein